MNWRGQFCDTGLIRRSPRKNNKGLPSWLQYDSLRLGVHPDRIFELLNDPIILIMIVYSILLNAECPALNIKRSYFIQADQDLFGNWVVEIN